MDNNHAVLTMRGGACPKDAGRMQFVRCNEKAIYFKCECCGYRDRYVFVNEEEAEAYAQDAKRKIFNKLRSAMVDWQLAQWDQLHREFVKFTIQYPMFEQDIHIQMAYVACITHGFNMLGDETYSQCQTRYTVCNKIYKAQLRLLKKQLMAAYKKTYDGDPSLLKKQLRLFKKQLLDKELPQDFGDYRELGDKYRILQFRYLGEKVFFSAVFAVAKKLGNPLRWPLPF